MGAGINAKKPADSENGEVLAAETLKVIFVELGSVNCIPCKMMQPVMNQVEKNIQAR